MNSQPQATLKHRGFIAEFMATLKGIFTDKGVLLMIVIAPMIYGFFYPWPYSTEVVHHVPVGIVDQDNTALSHTIRRYAAASPYLETQVYANEQQAQQAIWQDRIAGYMVIPSNLEAQVTAGKPASVSVLGNGGYFILNKNVQLGFAQAVGTVSAGVEIKRSVAQGAYYATAKTNSQAVPLHISPQYNRTEGYGAYVVPAVSILILQQTLLMGTAMLIGTWYERRRHHASTSGWLGRIAALSVVSYVMGCFFYGIVFNFQDYPRGQNLMGSLLFLALFCPTVAVLGCFFGLWFRQRERSLQILIFSSLPFFFVSGYPSQADLLPTLIQWLRWLVPTTSGMNASVQLNQMGASIPQVASLLMHLAALLVFYFLLLLALDSPKVRKALHLPPIH